MTTETIEVSREHLADVIHENIRLRGQIDELQRRCNELLMQRRGVPYQVREFREKMGFLNPMTPTVPSQDDLRLAARTMFSEVIELMCALFPSAREDAFANFAAMLSIFFNSDQVSSLNLIEVARELADVDYTIEGCRQAFGIDGGPVAVEVHRANMSKDPNIRDEHGKVLKPPGFRPPDVERVLIEQGLKCISAKTS